MVRIGKDAGKRTMAVVSDMDQPLGYAVGNALEVKEAIDTLSGKGPEDFKELCLTLGSCMLIAGGKAKNHQEAEDMLLATIENGSALKKFAEFVEAQGGDSAAVYDTERLPKAGIIQPIAAPRDVYISRIICDEIGIASLILGGGRETKTSKIDLSVGLVLTAKVGDYVKAGEPLAWIHANDEQKTEMARKRFLSAYQFSDKPVSPHKLIKRIIEL